MLVGGRDDDSCAPGESKKKVARSDTDLEPVFYHTLHFSAFEDIIFAAAGVNRKPKGIVDLTGGDGPSVRYAIQNRVPIVTFCLTDEHVTKLKKHSRDMCWLDMRTEGNPLFEPKLVELVQSVVDEFNVNDDNDPTSKAAEKQKKNLNRSLRLRSASLQSRILRRRPSRRSKLKPPNSLTRKMSQ